jgi:hypothetical protein
LGYSDNSKITKDLRLSFDANVPAAILGADLNFSKASTPILMLYDERVTRCAALLAEEYQSSLPENWL